MTPEEALTKQIDSLATKQTKLHTRRMTLRDESREIGAERNKLVGQRRRMRQLAALQAQGIDIENVDIEGALGTASVDGLEGGN